MKDYLISLFIDNEMDLGEKMEFVEAVHDDADFKNETLELLAQEKLLQGDMVTWLPPDRNIIKPKAGSNRFLFGLRCLAGVSGAFAVLAAAFFFFHSRPAEERQIPHRFVIYRPAAQQAEIIGSFTNWEPAPMEKMGDTGYWTLTLKLPAGEYRYSYLVEDGNRVADPTVLIREQDDFGGVNSILRIGGQA